MMHYHIYVAPQAGSEKLPKIKTVLLEFTEILGFFIYSLKNIKILIVKSKIFIIIIIYI